MAAPPGVFGSSFLETVTQCLAFHQTVRGRSHGASPTFDPSYPFSFSFSSSPSLSHRHPSYRTFALLPRSSK